MTQADTARRADILVVDDTPANLRLLSETLSEHDYRVRAVTSGARALASARATSSYWTFVCRRWTVSRFAGS